MMLHESQLNVIRTRDWFPLISVADKSIEVNPQYPPIGLRSIFTKGDFHMEVIGNLSELMKDTGVQR